MNRYPDCLKCECARAINVPFVSTFETTRNNLRNHHCDSKVKRKLTERISIDQQRLRRSAAKYGGIGFRIIQWNCGDGVERLPTRMKSEESFRLPRYATTNEDTGRKKVARDENVWRVNVGLNWSMTFDIDYTGPIGSPRAGVASHATCLSGSATQDP